MAPRWVADHAAVLAFGRQVHQFFVLNVQVGRYTCFGRVGSGERKNLAVVVGCQDRVGQPGCDGVFDFLSSLLPHVARCDGPVFAGERPVAAGRDIAADHGGFNRNGSGTAKRIDERSVAVPVAKQHKCGRRCFTQRSGARFLAIAAFVQSVAGCVQRDGGDVV